MMCGAHWRGEPRILDDLARGEAEGSFVLLDHGYTHFQAAGGQNGRPVVLIHGFSVPSFIWEPTFRALAEAGMRPIRYDLYGRGYSDRPRITYDLSLFMEQLRGLLAALGLVEVDLIGLSMGGPIAAAFTLAFPGSVRKLVLIDPSGTKPLDLGILYRLAILPGIGEVLFAIAAGPSMLRTIARDFFDPALVEAFLERYRTQMQFRGFKMAILSTVRHNLLGSFSATYAALGHLGKPVLVIWGEHDRTLPFEESCVLRALIPQAEFLAVPDSGHIPHYERPDVVNPRLLQFLS